jgi:hypothetical protein
MQFLCARVIGFASGRPAGRCQHPASCTFSREMRWCRCSSTQRRRPPGPPADRPAPASRTQQTDGQRYRQGVTPWFHAPTFVAHAGGVAPTARGHIAWNAVKLLFANVQARSALIAPPVRHVTPEAVLPYLRFCPGPSRGSLAVHLRKMAPKSVSLFLPCSTHRSFCVTGPRTGPHLQQFGSNELANASSCASHQH